MTADRRLVSAAFGFAAGLIVSMIGPLYGGLIVVMSSALVFRTEDRVAVRRVSVAFVASWLASLALGMTAARLSHQPLAVVAIDAVPIVLVVAMVILARQRSPSGRKATYFDS
jgi:hypothetical protein